MEPWGTRFRPTEMHLSGGPNPNPLQALSCSSLSCVCGEYTSHVPDHNQNHKPLHSSALARVMHNPHSAEQGFVRSNTDSGDQIMRSPQFDFLRRPILSVECQNGMTTHAPPHPPGDHAPCRCPAAGLARLAGNGRGRCPASHAARAAPRRDGGPGAGRPGRNGQRKREMTFKQDGLHGKETRYEADGTVSTVRYWLDGEPVSKAQYRAQADD